MSALQSSSLAQRTADHSPALPRAVRREATSSNLAVGPETRDCIEARANTLPSSFVASPTPHSPGVPTLCSPPARYIRLSPNRSLDTSPFNTRQPQTFIHSYTEPGPANLTPPRPGDRWFFKS
ncbi:unnamed protein product [Gadus morhua 'NCC']